MTDTLPDKEEGIPLELEEIVIGFEHLSLTPTPLPSRLLHINFFF